MPTTNSSILTTSQKALRAYRHCLRATKIAFDGDTRMLLASRSQLRQGMIDPPENQRDLSAAGRVQLLEDIALFLRRNVVQGRKVGVDPVTSKPQYHLNIHKDTELGDNDSIKLKTNLKSRSFPKSNTGFCGSGYTK